MKIHSNFCWRRNWVHWICKRFSSLVTFSLAATFIQNNFVIMRPADQWWAYRIHIYNVREIVDGISGLGESV